MRLIIASLVLYFSPTWRVFRWLHSRWWPGEVEPEQLEEHARRMRNRLWSSFAKVLFLVVVTITILRFTNVLESLPSRYLFRASAATVALTATLGRAGWAMQTWDGNTICERIDRGMFFVSQLGATSILLLALAL